MADPSKETAPEWPVISNGMMVAPFDPPSYTPAQQAAGIARAERAAGPRLNNFWPGVMVPPEVLYPEIPLIPMTGWEVYLGKRDGQPMLWIAHGDDVAEMAIPGPDASGVDRYADVRTLILRILADDDAMQ